MVSGKTKLIPTTRAGRARRACGEDVRQGEILAASVKQEPPCQRFFRLVGIHFLQGVVDVKKNRQQKGLTVHFLNP